jgi:hypothetical protein
VQYLREKTFNKSAPVSPSSSAPVTPKDKTRPRPKTEAGSAGMQSKLVALPPQEDAVSEEVEVPLETQPENMSWFERIHSGNLPEEEAAQCDEAALQAGGDFDNDPLLQELRDACVQEAMDRRFPQSRKQEDFPEHDAFGYQDCDDHNQVPRCPTQDMVLDNKFEDSFGADYTATSEQRFAASNFDDGSDGSYVYDDDFCSEDGAGDNEMDEDEDVYIPPNAEVTDDLPEAEIAKFDKKPGDQPLSPGLALERENGDQLVAWMRNTESPTVATFPSSAPIVSLQEVDDDGEDVLTVVDVGQLRQQLYQASMENGFTPQQDLDFGLSKYLAEKRSKEVCDEETGLMMPGSPGNGSAGGSSVYELDLEVELEINLDTPWASFWNGNPVFEDVSPTTSVYGELEYNRETATLMWNGQVIEKPSRHDSGAGSVGTLSAAEKAESVGTLPESAGTLSAAEKASNSTSSLERVARSEVDMFLKSSASSSSFPKGGPDSDEQVKIFMTSDSTSSSECGPRVEVDLRKPLAGSCDSLPTTSALSGRYATSSKESAATYNSVGAPPHMLEADAVLKRMEAPMSQCSDPADMSSSTAEVSTAAATPMDWSTSIMTNTTDDTFLTQPSAFSRQCTS